MKTIRFFIAILAITLTIINTSFAQKNKAVDIVKTYYAATDAGNTAEFDKLLSANFMANIPGAPMAFDKANFKGFIQGFKQGFPDMKHEALDWITDGKKVAVKGVFKGTNTGALQGNPPTGKMVVLPFNTIFEFDDNWKIKAIVPQFDQLTFQKQLMPDMASPEQIKKNCWAAYDALNRRDYEAFKKTVTADFIEYTAGPAPIKGVDACLEAYKQYFAMAPDMKFDIKNIAVDGNKVYVESAVTGTNTGMVMGMLPATGKKVKTMDVDILTVDAQGRATSHSTANPNEFFVQIGYAAYTNPNTSLVMAIFEKFQKRDAPAFLALIDDAFVYDAKDHPILSRMQAYKGKTEFTGWVKEYNEKIQNVKLEPQRFFADGDDVMVTLNVEYILKATGKSYSVPLVQHWRFKEGKAVWLKAIGGKPMETMATAKN